MAEDGQIDARCASDCTCARTSAPVPASEPMFTRCHANQRRHAPLQSRFPRAEVVGIASDQHAGGDRSLQAGGAAAERGALLVDPGRALLKRGGCTCGHVPTVGEARRQPQCTVATAPE